MRKTSWGQSGRRAPMRGGPGVSHPWRHRAGGAARGTLRVSGLAGRGRLSAPAAGPLFVCPAFPRGRDVLSGSHGALQQCYRAPIPQLRRGGLQRLTVGCLELRGLYSQSSTHHSNTWLPAPAPEGESRTPGVPGGRRAPLLSPHPARPGFADLGFPLRLPPHTQSQGVPEPMKLWGQSGAGKAGRVVTGDRWWAGGRGRGPWLCPGRTRRSPQAGP